MRNRQEGGKDLRSGAGFFGLHFSRNLGILSSKIGPGRFHLNSLPLPFAPEGAVPG